MLPMRRTGTPAPSIDVFAEEPYLANWVTCSTVAQHHPFGSSCNLLVSGAAGSTYFFCQFFGGSFSAVADLASWSSSHFLRRSAKIPSRTFVVVTFLKCWARHCSVSLPSTAAFSTEAR